MRRLITPIALPSPGGLPRSGGHNAQSAFRALKQLNPEAR
jgi:hypothetical protein